MSGTAYWPSWAGISSSNVQHSGETVSSRLDALSQKNYLTARSNSAVDFAGTNVSVQWETEQAQSGAALEIDGTDNTHINIGETGDYSLSFALDGDVSAIGVGIRVFAKLNGVTAFGSRAVSTQPPTGSVKSSVASASIIIPLSAGQYITVVCNKEGSTSGTWTLSPSRGFFFIMKVS